MSIQSKVRKIDRLADLGSLRNQMLDPKSIFLLPRLIYIPETDTSVRGVNHY